MSKFLWILGFAALISNALCSPRLSPIPREAQIREPWIFWNGRSVSRMVDAPLPNLNRKNSPPTFNQDGVSVRQAKGSCPLGGVTCEDGCAPSGSSCCSNRRYCSSGLKCCSDEGCAPKDGACCGNGESCRTGYQCCTGGGCCLSEGWSCCPGKKGCVPDGGVCCADGNYCRRGYSCCEEGCCPDNLSGTPGSENSTKPPSTTASLADSETMAGKSTTKTSGLPPPPPIFAPLGDNDNGESDKGESGKQEEGSSGPQGLPSPKTTPSPTPRPKRACFTILSTVELENGDVKPMKDVLVGDRVRVGYEDDAFSEVFMFTHADPEYYGTNFVKVTTESGRSITASIGHHIYSSQTQTPAETTLPIERIAVGSYVYFGSKPDPVVRVDHEIFGKGLYNPQTIHGDILVDGALATTYTSAVEPALAHGLLAPFRMYYRFFGYVKSLVASQ